MQLSVADLTCRRGGRELFSGLSFSLAAGEALVVTGRNGSGKSSLLRLIAGLLRADGGQISLKGGNAEASIGEQAHYLGHQDALKPSLTVEENLRFWSAYLGPAENPPEHALERLRLGGTGRPARRLSFGRSKAAAVARPADHRTPAALAARRAGLRSRRRRPTRLAELMQLHLTRGGLILAAAHGPIGLAGAQELRLGVAP